MEARHPHAIPRSEVDKALANVTDTGDISADNTDSDVLYNLGFSAGVGLLFLITFSLLRLKLKRVYASNFCGEQRPRLSHSTGFMGWLSTTIRTSDPELLSFAGMDAFLLVQVMKLLFALMLTLTIPMLFVLGPLYYFSGSEASIDSFYMRLSILNCSAKFLWIPFVVCYLTSLLIFYYVYVFYRNYALVRQAYLKDPSALTSCLVLQRLVGITGSIDEARRVAALHNRAVILEGISEKYTRDQLHELLAHLPIGAPTSITFINPRDELVAVVEKRNGALTSLEESFHSFLRHAFESLRGDRSKASFVEELMKRPALSGKERMVLLERLRNPAFHPEHRPHTKNRDGIVVDAISYYHDRLVVYERKLDECIEDYLAGYEEDNDPSATTTGTSDQPTKTDTKEVRRAMIDQSTLMSFRKFSWFGHNLKDIKLTLYGTSQSAIVMMETPRAASAASQAVLSRRPFSLSAGPAPPADDIMWDNLQLSPADRNLRQTAGEIMFVLANIFFIPFATALSTLTQLDKLTSFFPWLEDWISSSPKLRSTLQGILAPLALNIALGLAPFLLHLIAIYQGRASKTATLQSLIRKYCWFLFFQSFVVIIITASLVDVINDILDGKWDKILGSLRETFPLKSSLYFNIIIQKAFISTGQLLLKPGALFFGLLGAATSFRATPRTIHEYLLSTDFDYGQDYPQYVVFLTQIILAFMSITPITLLAGIVFYGIAAVCYRHAALFTHHTRHESGGLCWQRIAQHLIIGCLLNQVFLLLHFTVRGAAFQAIFLAPLLFSTLGFMKFLGRSFEQRCSNLPQTEEDEAIVDKLISDLLQHQNQMLRPPVEDPNAPKEDEGEKEVAEFIPVKQLLKLDTPGTLSASTAKYELYSVGPSDLSNPYGNPVLFKRLAAVCLHPLLLPILKELSETETE